MRILAFRKRLKYSFEKGVSVSVTYNDCLHGKAYLLYYGNEGKGCIITSGNFTDNGLKNNHEYGVFLDNESMQKEFRNQIYSLACSGLSYEEVIELLAKADEFSMKNSETEIPVFKAADYIKNRMILPDNCRFFIKVLGAEGRPIGLGYTIIEDNEIGFRKIPFRISKDDILVCHAKKVGKVVGDCKIMEIKAEEKTNFDTDRWNQKLPTSCISEKYSLHWWDYDIRTLDLEAEYNETKKEGEHITIVGGDKLKGCLQCGCVEITREFAQFVIDRISKV